MCRIQGCPKKPAIRLQAVKRSSQLEEAESTLRQIYLYELARLEWRPARRDTGSLPVVFFKDHGMDGTKGINHPDWLPRSNLGEG